MTSVLFADLVGFTPLSESKDAEEVRELLSVYFESCRTVIGRYGGVVEKFIGDAVMAVWGVPVAHEDDAERAVRAGMELAGMVAALGEEVGVGGLAMRVGVVTGEVAVTLGATAEGMVAGDAVNTASRVQSIADPGQVWVDETTRVLAAAAISFSDVGSHVLKGKAEALSLFAARAVVAEVGGVQRVDGLEAPLTGRDRELRLVKELFHACEESHRPHLVVLDGTAGIGKSRLAWEFQKYIDGLSSTVRWHRGRCLSYGDGVAFWALAEAVRGRLGLTEGDSADQVGVHLEQGLRTFVPDMGERDWLRPRLAALIGVTGAPTYAREDLFGAWATFLERVGDGAPVVLVVDDAQYADDGLLDFLDYLMAAAREGIFVLALARPELLERRRDLGGRRATVIRLEPLADSSMEMLVDGLVQGMPAATRAALVARADGVPLFAVETVRALIDRDAVVPRDGRYVAADDVDVDLEAIGAPASLQALVAARLDALTHDERRVVAGASVLGASFTADGLVALGEDEGALGGVLEALQRKEIVALQTDRFSAERGQYRFVQGVVRQVAYGTQSRRDRKARHLAAADYLAAQPDSGDDLAVVIAQHLLDAAEATPGDADSADVVERARGQLERAAARAARVGSPAEAKRLYESALRQVRDGAEQARLHLSAAQAAWEAGELASAVSHAESATRGFDVLGRPADAGLAAGVHALALSDQLDNAGAIAVAEPRWQELTAARLPDSEPALLKLGSALSVAHRLRGETDRIAEYQDQVILLAEAVGDPDALAQAQNGLGIVFMARGAPLTGIGQFELSAATARHYGLSSRLANALNNLTAFQVSRDLSAALESGREGREVARRSGVAAIIDYTASNYLVALWTAGRIDESRALLAEARDDVTDPAIRIMFTTVEAWLAEAYGQPLPDPPPEEAMDSENALAWRGALDVAHAARARDVAAVSRIASRTLSHLLAAAGIEDDFFVIWPTLVAATLAVGDENLARQLLEPVESAAAYRVAPGVAAQHRRLRALIAAARGDDPSGVEADFRAAIAALEAFGARAAWAQTQAELGEWLVGQGRGGEAAAPLEQARACYIQLGARGWLAGLNRAVDDSVLPRG